jgi:hypothetical protein
MKAFKNCKGTTIKRGGVLRGCPYRFGKIIGGNVYLHMSQFDHLPYKRAATTAYKKACEFIDDINCVRFCPTKSTYMFSNSPDFDTAREPIVGKSIIITVKGGEITTSAIRYYNQIWHHKWMWVGDDYNDFDIYESYEWSKNWSSKISSPSGYKELWDKQLNNIGLK